MNTFRQFELLLSHIPTVTTFYLSDVSEARGRQDLFIHQFPQKLKVLKEHAQIQSAISSNRIEGVTIAPTRIGTVMFGKPQLIDRNEEEISGYRKVLDQIHTRGYSLSLSEDLIRDFHRIIRGNIWDAGQYKVEDGEIVEKLPNGHQRVRFKPVSAVEAPEYLRKLVVYWDKCLKENWVPPLIALAAFNLDFLCIHPFRDGNGRVSRLLLLLQSYHLGFEVGRYISLERIIEENKERYYETLELSSQGWHENQHDPWPFINFILYILKIAYREFEQQMARLKNPKGAKTELIETAIQSMTAEFSVSDLERACPGVSRDMIRRVLRVFQKNRWVECLGRGPGAKWSKRGITLKKR